MIPLLVKVLTFLSISPLSPLIKKAARWFLVVGDTVEISKSDVNDDISLTFPESPN